MKKIDLEYLLVVQTSGRYLLSVSVVLACGTVLWSVGWLVCWVGSVGNRLELCVFGLYLCSRLSFLFWAPFLEYLAERRQI